MHLTDWTHRIDLREELQEIYLHRFLFTLAIGTVSIFLPLYLYDLGVAIPDIFGFFIVYYLVFILAAWPVAHLAARFGYKHTSLAAAPIILAFYLVLRSLTGPSMLVHVAGGLGGLGFITYWIGMNAEMARNTHDDSRDRETGYFFSLPLIASIGAPFLGGLVVATAGFPALFLLATGIVAVSFTPFLFSTEHYRGMDAPRDVLDRAHIRDFGILMLRGANDLGRLTIWPLYLAVVLTNAVTIGGAGALLALGGAAVSIGVGHIVTDATRHRVMLTGGLLTALTWLGMTLVATPVQAFTAAFCNGVAYHIVVLPLYSRVLETASREDPLAYFAFREIALSTGRIVLLAAATALFIAFSVETAFLATFGLLAAAATILGVTGATLGTNRRRSDPAM